MTNMEMNFTIEVKMVLIIIQITRLTSINKQSNCHLIMFVSVVRNKVIQLRFLRILIQPMTHIKAKVSQRISSGKET